MSDTQDPTMPNADRLKSVVGNLQQTILALPRFRPPGIEQAADFDKLQADLLQTMVDVTQAAAVDAASIAVALSMIDRGQKALAESEKTRADVTAKMAERVLTFPISRGA